MTNILIITYYWPPAGGAGVQRWVKLSKYLKRAGVNPIILTVDEQSASYMQLDPSLENDVADDLEVIKTKSFEPINWYAKMVGKKNVPTAGFSNVNNKKWSQRIVNYIRSNLFIPDPRKGWNKFALKAATKLIQQENISLVITSSPPHSSQLIGLKLKNSLGIKWIADMRDPWTDIYYFDQIGHSRYSKAISKRMEKAVLMHADKVITVSNSLVELFRKKDVNIDPEKFVVVPNCFDPEDFENLEKVQNDFFHIVYTGSMSAQYAPDVFFEALKESISGKPGLQIQVTMVGEVADEIKAFIEKIEIKVHFKETVPHSSINQWQKNADLLLLVIPNVKESEGILTGKLFEYLASGNPILGIGPENGDAAHILRECQCGDMFNRNQLPQIVDHLLTAFERFENHSIHSVNESCVKLYSRQKQAEDIHQLIMRLS